MNKNFKEHKCAKQRSKRCALCELGITNEVQIDLKLLEKKIYQSDVLLQGEEDEFRERLNECILYGKDGIEIKVESLMTEIEQVFEAQYADLDTLESAFNDYIDAIKLDESENELFANAEKIQQIFDIRYEISHSEASRYNNWGSKIGYLENKFNTKLPSWKYFKDFYESEYKVLCTIQVDYADSLYYLGEDKLLIFNEKLANIYNIYDGSLAKEIDSFRKYAIEKTYLIDDERLLMRVGPRQRLVLMNLKTFNYTVTVSDEFYAFFEMISDDIIACVVIYDYRNGEFQDRVTFLKINDKSKFKMIYSITIGEYTNGKQFPNITGLAALPNKMLAGSCADGYVRIWDFEAKKEICIFKAFDVNETSVYANYLKEEDLLMCYCNESIIKFLNYRTGECMRVVDTYERVFDLIKVRNGECFATCGIYSINIFERRNWQLCKSIPIKAFIKFFYMSKIVEVDDKHLAAIDTHKITIFEY